MNHVPIPIPDLRHNYDETAPVKDGKVYRKGQVLQVWWTQDVMNRRFRGTQGRETWTFPDYVNMPEKLKEFVNNHKE